MCTRYYMDDSTSELTAIIEAVKKSPLYNNFIARSGKPVITNGEVRPTDIAPVIAPSKKGIPTVYPMRWGFKNPDHDSTLFNARLETAGTKPTFKDAWNSHRCIIPANYYFEWKHYKDINGNVKTGQKYAIQPSGATVTYLCGLYRIENDFPVFVILTKEPSEQIKALHDRMPLILPREKIDEWINPESLPANLLKYAITDMVFEPVEETRGQIPNQMSIKYVT